MHNVKTHSEIQVNYIAVVTCMITEVHIQVTNILLAVCIETLLINQVNL